MNIKQPFSTDDNTDHSTDNNTDNGNDGNTDIMLVIVMTIIKIINNDNVTMRQPTESQFNSTATDEQIQQRQ